MDNYQDINIDNALSLLNSQISKFEKKVNEQSKRDTYILHTEAVGNKTFDISEREDDDFEDEDDVILSMSFEKQMKSSIFMKPFEQRDVKNDTTLPRNTHRSKANFSSKHVTSFGKDDENNMSLYGKKDFKSNNGTNSGLFSSSNENSLSSFKYMPSISKSNAKPKNTGSHGYLDSAYAGTSSSSASSPFINQNSQFGGSTFFANSTSPFNKHHNTENNEFNNTKKAPLISQNSFKRSNSIKRSTSVKKYTNNLNLYLTNNNIGINNTSNQQITSKNQPIVNLQSKIEEEVKLDKNLSTGTDYHRQRGSFSRESELDTLDFINRQPPPPLSMPHRNNSNSGFNNIIPLSSSNTGSSLYSSGSNQLGLFSIKSNDNKVDTLEDDDFAFDREDLNKTPIVSMQNNDTMNMSEPYGRSKKLPPKTPDRTNDLLYKLNTDFNFEAESIEVMSAISQNSFGSGNINPSKSMIFNKYDLLKLSEHGPSNLTLSESRDHSQPEVDTQVDLGLKKIIHLPVINTKLEYNQDGIALLSTKKMIEMITENEAKKKLVGNQLFIIDCRFPREFNEGHIQNSLNIYDFERLFDFLKHLLATSESTQITQFKIVFYCEFSQYRSPKLSKFLRKLDRLINIKYWPYLIYPDLFILDGGIYQFQENNAGLMRGQYKSMNDCYKDHNTELDDHLRIFRKQVGGYLGEDNDTSKKNNDHDTFDKMVHLKNVLMDCIEKRI